jgi:hypothetical protein
MEAAALGSRRCQPPREGEWERGSRRCEKRRNVAAGEKKG